MSATPDIDIEALDIERLLQEASREEAVPAMPSAQEATPLKDPMAQFNTWIREAATPVPCGSAQTPTPTPAAHHSASGVSASPYSGGMGTPQVMRPFADPAVAGYASAGASPFGGFASIHRLQTAPGGGEPARLSPLTRATPVGVGGYSLLNQESVRVMHTPTRTSPLMRVSTAHDRSPDWFNGSASSLGPATDTSSRHGLQTAHSSFSGRPMLYQTAFPLQATIEEFAGRVVELAKDQTGCRCLQQVLDLPFDAPEVQAVLHEIFPCISELMADQYGNFLIQKLLDVSPDPVRLSITRAIATTLPLVAMTQHGTFAVQKLIESFRSEEEANIALAGLATGVVGLMKDPFGGHVVQKVLTCLRPDQNQFLFDGLAHHAVEICTDKQGCCVAQRCIENGSPEQRAFVLRSVMMQWSSLISHPYGNYVLQFCMANIQNGANYFVDLLLQTTRGAPTLLAAVGTNKFGSNVLERALSFCSPEYAARMIQRLSQLDTLGPLILDSYGNYVIQTALSQAPLPALPHLLAAITPNLPQVRSQNYGRKFEAKVDAARERLQHQVPPPHPEAAQRGVHQRSSFGGKATPTKSPQQSGRSEAGTPQHSSGSPHHKPRNPPDECLPSARRQIAPPAVDGSPRFTLAQSSAGPGSAWAQRRPQEARVFQPTADPNRVAWKPAEPPKPQAASEFVSPGPV